MRGASPAARHPGVSNAAASVLAAAYGDSTAFTLTSAGLPGVERSFPTFSAAIAQIEEARVLGGMHFRFACAAAARTGAAVADYVDRTLMLPLRANELESPTRRSMTPRSYEADLSADRCSRSTDTAALRRARVAFFVARRWRQVLQALARGRPTALELFRATQDAEGPGSPEVRAPTVGLRLPVPAAQAPRSG